MLIFYKTLLLNAAVEMFNHEIENKLLFAFFIFCKNR